MHRYDAAKSTLPAVPETGGVPAAMRAIEGAYAFAWATNIRADTLAQPIARLPVT